MIDSERVAALIMKIPCYPYFTWDRDGQGAQNKDHQLIRRADVLAALTADAQPVGGAPLEREQNYALALKLIKRAQQSKEPHIWIPYFSTYCLHGNHEACRANCKSCQNPCKCDCGHTTPEPLVYKDADAPESFGNDEKSRRLAAVKGACARAAGFGRHAEHGYAGRNADSWLFGWDYCNDCLSRSDYKPPAGQEMVPPADPLHSWEQIEKAIREDLDGLWSQTLIEGIVASVHARLTARERVTVEPCNRSNAHEPDWEIRCDGVLLETISYLDGKPVADGYALRVKAELAQQKEQK